ncbi:MAG TPA: hypothetical protein VL084_14375 [Thermoanaerobaculia bacterium]|nr:hypothetical protein [Thermoanaerobaculia bacterium]
MSHRLQVLIPEQLDRRIAKAASRRRLSKGAWVRRTLEKALGDAGGTEDPLRKLGSLGAPTGEIRKMLAEIEAGRK